MKLDKATSIFIIILLLLCIYPVIGTDTGWHIRVGEYIATRAAIPKVDFLSFSMEGYPYVYHSWLTSVLMYFLYKVGAFWGVAALYAGFLTLGLFILTRRGEKNTPDRYFVALCSIPLVITFVGFRVQTVSFFFLAVLQYHFVKELLLDPSLTLSTFVRNKTLWRIVLLFAVWSNFHGGFVLGLVLVAFLIIAQIIFRFLTFGLVDMRILCVQGLIVLALCVGATGLNPYGFRPLLLAWHMQTNQTALAVNYDWRPLMQFTHDAQQDASKDLLIVGLAFVGTQFLLRDKKHTQALLVVAFLLLCFLSTRFSLVILVLVLPVLVSEGSRIVVKAKKSLYPGMFGLVFAALLVLGMGLLNASRAYCAHTSEVCYAQLSRLSTIAPYYPFSAMQYMRENGVPSRLLNNFNHGGYLHLYFPDQKFFIDGRMDNFFIDGKSFVDEYIALIHAKTGWEERFAGYGFNGYLGRKEWELSGVLLEKGWRVVSEDDVNTLMLPPE